jgi:hypothetical protein
MCVLLQVSTTTSAKAAYIATRICASGEPRPFDSPDGKEKSTYVTDVQIPFSGTCTRLPEKPLQAARMTMLSV